MTLTGTYTKLRSGDWGVRIQGTAQEGAQVRVTKKDGSVKMECIHKVVWTGNGVSLCAIQRSSGGYSRRTSGYDDGLRDAYRHGWDGKIGSPSYYSSGAFDEIDM